MASMLARGLTSQNIWTKRLFFFFPFNWDKIESNDLVAPLIDWKKLISKYCIKREQNLNILNG